MNKYKGFSKMWFLVLLLVTFVTGCASNGTEVNSGALVSVVVTPSQAIVPVSGTQQYTLTAIYGNGSSSDVTAASDWTATNVVAGADVAEVSSAMPTKGLATAKAIGQSTITAKYLGKTVTATLTVNAATSKKFEVIPSGVSPLISIPVTGTLQYTAVETFSDGSSFDRTAASLWSAGTAGVSWNATKGLATGAIASNVPVVITASYTNIAGVTMSKTANLTVNAATSTSFKIKPSGVSPSPLVSIPVSGTQQYTAIETFSDGSSYDRTADSLWSASTAGVSWDMINGHATGAIANVVPVVITASYTNLLNVTKTDTAPLTVNDAVTTTFEVRPSGLAPSLISIPVKGTQLFTAIETFSDGTSYDRTTVSDWSAPDAIGGKSIAVIGLHTGVATGNAEGSTSNITATYTNPAGVIRSDKATLTVTSAAVVSIVVTPSPATIVLGATQTFKALAIFSDGSTPLDVTTDQGTVWNSASSNVASFVASPVTGIATGDAVGTSDITAAYGGKTSPIVVLTVTATPVNPPTLAINLRSAATFGIASRAGMTSSGVTVVTGDIALSPITSCTDATGGPGGASQSCLSKVYASSTGMTVNGSIYWATDGDTPPGGTASSVVHDLNLAWIEGKNKANTQPVGYLGGELGAPLASGGKTIAPGIYEEGTTLILSAGNLAILNGSATDVWIFKVGSSLTDYGILTNPTEIRLVGGALARNVWFVTQASATIGAGTIWNGNILAGSTVTVNSTSTVMGRVLSGADLSGGLLTLTNTVAGIPTTITVPQ